MITTGVGECHWFNFVMPGIRQLHVFVLSNLGGKKEIKRFGHLPIAEINLGSKYTYVTLNFILFII